MDRHVSIVDIGERMWQARKRQAISRIELGKVLQVPKLRIMRAERAESSPSAQYVAACAVALKVPLAYLYAIEPLPEDDVIADYAVMLENGALVAPEGSDVSSLRMIDATTIAHGIMISRIKARYDRSAIPNIGFAAVRLDESPESVTRAIRLLYYAKLYNVSLEQIYGIEPTPDLYPGMVVDL